MNLTPWTRRIAVIGLSVMAVAAIAGAAFGNIPAEFAKDITMIVAAGFVGAIKGV